jgi:hypothetical protein
MDKIKVLAKGIAVLSSGVLMLSSLSGTAWAEEIEYVGLPINVYVDTQSPEVAFLVPENSVENIEDIEGTSGLLLSNSNSGEFWEINCPKSGSGLNCSIPQADFTAITGSGNIWQQDSYVLWVTA